MADLLVRDLVIATGGRLTLAAMPPRDGDLQMLRRFTATASDVHAGDVFWALPGESDDGMRHVEEAFARGASGAVTCGRMVEPWPGKFTVAVDDARQALWRAAAHARSRFEGAVIATAGSLAGLTATVLHRVLGSQLSGSLTSLAFAKCEIASDPTALGLLNAHPSHDYLVVPLADVDSGQRCCPHLVVAPGTENPALVAELLESLPDNGWAVLNGDDRRVRDAVAPLSTASLRVVWCGNAAENDLVLSQAGVDTLPELAAVAVAKILNISDLSVFSALGIVPPAVADSRVAYTQTRVAVRDFSLPTPLMATWLADQT